MTDDQISQLRAALRAAIDTAAPDTLRVITAAYLQFLDADQHQETPTCDKPVQ